MYYMTQKGFGPFKKWVLVEKVTPKHKEIVVKPDSIKGVFIRPEGHGLFSIETNRGMATHVTRFDNHNGCLVFTDKNGDMGLVTRDKNVVNHRQYNDVTVCGNVAVLRVLNPEKSTVTYQIVSSKNGQKLDDKEYYDFTMGNESSGVRRNVLFLKQKNLSNTVYTSNGVMLGNNCIKCEGIDDQVLLLRVVRDGKNPPTTVLDCYTVPKFGAPVKGMTIKGVADFSATREQLIVKRDKDSEVYDYVGEEKQPFIFAFAAEGKVSDIRRTFYSAPVYISDRYDHIELLDNNGIPSRNPDLQGLVAVRYADDQSLITTVKRNNEEREGLIRDNDYATILPPIYDEVKTYGPHSFMGTFADTFALFQLSEVEEGKYSITPTEVLPLNRFFNPLLPKVDYVVQAQDSMGAERVLTVKDGQYTVSPEQEYCEPARIDLCEDESVIGIPTEHISNKEQ